MTIYGKAVREKGNLKVCPAIIIDAQGVEQILYWALLLDGKEIGMYDTELEAIAAFDDHGNNGGGKNKPTTSIKSKRPK